MTKEEKETFAAAAEPMIKWLAENVHPHHRVIVDSVSAELLEGRMSHTNVKFLRD